MKFKHIDTCWYFNKLDHRGKPYEWPCCGETTECDDAFVNSLKAENARLRAALQRIAMRCQNCDEGNEYATCICFSEPFADQIARAALEGKE